MGLDRGHGPEGGEGMNWPDDYIPEGFTPYHIEDAGIIFNCDCREILPHLPKVEIIVADPPYGIDYQSNRRIARQRKAKIEGDKDFPLWIFDFMSPSIAFFVWCRWDILTTIPKPKSFIVWGKCVHSMGDLEHEFGRQWEACAFYPGPYHQFIKRPADIIRTPKVPSEKILHPNEKPVEAIKPLIRSHDGIILDPFLGSGTTAVAAKELGRKFIGIEISEEYCKIAVKRLRQGVLPF